MLVLETPVNPCLVKLSGRHRTAQDALRHAIHFSHHGNGRADAQRVTHALGSPPRSASAAGVLGRALASMLGWNLGARRIASARPTLRCHSAAPAISVSVSISISVLVSVSVSKTSSSSTLQLTQVSSCSPNLHHLAARAPLAPQRQRQTRSATVWPTCACPSVRRSARCRRSYSCHATVAPGASQSGTRRRQARAGQAWSRGRRGSCRRSPRERGRQPARRLENAGRKSRCRALPLADIARHVMGCLPVKRRRFKMRLDEVASDIRRLALLLRAVWSARSREREAEGCRGRGLHPFPFQLNLSSSVHRITQINS